MRKFFTVIARFFASIFAILFVITTVLALLLTTLGRQLFNANLYKNALSEQQIYERLPGILGEMLTSTISFNPCAESPVTCEDISPELKACYEQALGSERYITLASGKDQSTESEQAQIQSCLDQYGTPAQTVTLGGSGGQGGMPPFMNNLSASNWETLIKLILPPKDLQSMVESVLDQTFAYLNGETDTAKLSLVKLRENLTGPAGTEILIQLLRFQPACTEAELTKINVGLASGDTIYCNPPDDETLNKMLPNLEEQLNSAMKGIPNEAVIIKPPEASSPVPGSGPFGADPITTIRTVRLILRLSFLLPLAFLMLVTLFGVRSFKGWLRWWGIPIFFAGIITLGPGIAAMPALNWAWNTYVVVRIPPFIPTNIADIGHELVRTILHSLTEQIVLQAIVLILVGLAAWIGSYFVKTRHVESIPPVPPPAPTI